VDKVPVGIIVGIVLVGAFAGYFVFNPFNPSTTPVNNGNGFNQVENNTTYQDNIFPVTTLLSFIPFSGEVYSSAQSSSNPTPEPGPSPDPMDHVISLFDQYLRSYYNQSLIPGMAVVIVQNDKILYMNCLGVKDLASGEPVDENTLFGICSITKQFSATNIAL